MTTTRSHPSPRLAMLACAALAGAAPLYAGSSRVEEERLNVVVTIPVLAEVARAVGGDNVTVQCLSDPRQNPHFVRPRPTLMNRARKADVFVEVGVALEPWAQQVAAGSGNNRIQIGQLGRIVAADGLSTLEVPTRMTRAEGSIHPAGNPYVWLDPLNVKRMATNVANGFARLDPGHASAYEERLESYHASIDEALFGAKATAAIGGAKLERLARQGRLEAYLAEREVEIGGWLAKAAPLEGRNVAAYHVAWSYFAARFGFVVGVAVEEKPGIPPSSTHRKYVVEAIESQGLRTILIESYQDRRTTLEIGRETGANVIALPVDAGPEVDVADYFALIDLTLDRLLESEQGG